MGGWRPVACAGPGCWRDVAGGPAGLPTVRSNWIVGGDWRGKQAISARVQRGQDRSGLFHVKRNEVENGRLERPAARVHQRRTRQLEAPGKRSEPWHRAFPHFRTARRAGESPATGGGLPGVAAVPRLAGNHAAQAGNWCCAPWPSVNPAEGRDLGSPIWRRLLRFRLGIRPDLRTPAQTRRDFAVIARVARFPGNPPRLSRADLTDARASGLHLLVSRETPRVADRWFPKP